jgi:hypothetical protein
MKLCISQTEVGEQVRVSCNLEEVNLSATRVRSEGTDEGILRRRRRLALPFRALVLLLDVLF